MQQNTLFLKGQGGSGIGNINLITWAARMSRHPAYGCGVENVHLLALTCRVDSLVYMRKEGHPRCVGSKLYVSCALPVHQAHLLP